MVLQEAEEGRLGMPCLRINSVRGVARKESRLESPVRGLGAWPRIGSTPSTLDPA